MAVDVNERRLIGDATTCYSHYNTFPAQRDCNQRHKIGYNLSSNGFNALENLVLHSMPALNRVEV